MTRCEFLAAARRLGYRGAVRLAAGCIRRDVPSYRMGRRAWSSGSDPTEGGRSSAPWPAPVTLTATYGIKG